MKRMDFNCFSGNWPFHKIRHNSVEKIAQLHKRCNIEGGFISSCEAIFYQDPYEAQCSLAKELIGTPYMHAIIVNPMLSGWKDDLVRAVENLNIKAVRILPGFHNYSLADEVMCELCDMLRKYKLPLIITLRMEDERVSYMFHPNDVSLTDVITFLQANKDIVTLVANIRLREMESLFEHVDDRLNLFVDTSGLKDGLFAMEKAYQSKARDHIIYGSLAPLFEMQSTVLLVEAADMGNDVKDEIFSGENFLSMI